MFVFDNLMFAVCEDKNKLDKLHGYVMKDCHNYNCSLIFVCQDFIQKAEKLRKILSNSNPLTHRAKRGTRVLILTCVESCYTCGY